MFCAENGGDLFAVEVFVYIEVVYCFLETKPLIAIHPRILCVGGRNGGGWSRLTWRFDVVRGGQR